MACVFGVSISKERTGVFLGSLNDTQKLAVQSYQNTMAMMCAEWPPPPGGGRGNG